MATPFVFFLDSDTHFGSKNSVDPGQLVDIRSDKVHNVRDLTAAVRRAKDAGEDVKCLIATGDLTENGWDGKKACCVPYGGLENELSALVNKYVTPLESLMPVYLCAGNHDRAGGLLGHNGVLSYIKTRHNTSNLCYSFNINTVHFVCCDLSPQKSRLDWLKKDLRQLAAGTPVIVFFHYNIDGPYSDWWAPKQKNDPDGSKKEALADQEQEKFHEAIELYNVIGILVGHWHNSYTQTDFHGIPVISAAGDGCVKCTVDPAAGTIRTVKVHPDDGSPVPVERVARQQNARGANAGRGRGSPRGRAPI